MAEVLFVLLTIYVVYVVQSVFSKKETKKEDIAVEKAEVPAEVVSDKAEKVVVEKEKPAVKKVAPVKISAPKPAAVKKSTAAKPTSKAKAKAAPKTKPKAKAVVSNSLRNPETGDVDKIATSYRMTKRWIKDALVTEGLLPKVYKTTELDDATKLKAKKAIDKMAKMDKYQ